jgi:hypothetical protein
MISPMGDPPHNAKKIMDFLDELCHSDHFIFLNSTKKEGEKRWNLV